jgi:thioredoxin reductase
VLHNYDIIVVGGGPAGLSAALMLGRCRRRVLVCDSGRYRNAASGGVHGFLSRDCILPAELLEISRRQLEPYGVKLLRIAVAKIARLSAGFKVTLADRTTCTARRILLATGVTDRVPEIANVDQFYGSSVHHCPYCDAWEHQDQPLAVYGRGRPGIGLALSLKTWSDDVVLCTDGRSNLRPSDRDELERNSILLHSGRIAKLEGTGGSLERIVFIDGRELARKAIFFNTGQFQTCSLAEDLGCEFTKRGAIKTDKFEKTSVPGVFAAGDCSRNVQFVAVAAAQGAIAAAAINVELQREDRR